MRLYTRLRKTFPWLFRWRTITVTPKVGYKCDCTDPETGIDYRVNGFCPIHGYGSVFTEKGPIFK